MRVLCRLAIHILYKKILTFSRRFKCHNRGQTPCFRPLPLDAKFSQLEHRCLIWWYAPFTLKNPFLEKCQINLSLLRESRTGMLWINSILSSQKNSCNKSVFQAFAQSLLNNHLSNFLVTKKIVILLSRFW